MTPTISFLIAGNHADPEGNAIPKAKLTRGQQWTEKAQSYAAWKLYVAAAFMNSRPPYAGQARRFVAMTGKPIALEPQQEARMDLKIWWANEHHPDPENVFGSIADALFENDKHLSGSFEARHDPEKKGRVEVSITIYDNAV